MNGAEIWCDGKVIVSEPIVEFESIEKAYECLKEWQTKLFLDDWTIKLNLEHMEVDGADTVGYCNSEPVINAAVIYITPADKIPDDVIVKSCAEKTLVHELLHCVFPTLEHDTKSIEAALYEKDRHSIIEKMAKSLIMAKYDIDFNWFKNF